MIKDSWGALLQPEQKSIKSAIGTGLGGAECHRHQHRTQPVSCQPCDSGYRWKVKHRGDKKYTVHLVCTQQQGIQCVLGFLLCQPPLTTSSLVLTFFC